jgi:S1-C subfamily serine protease
MKKVPLYSKSRRSPTDASASKPRSDGPAAGKPSAAAPAPSHPASAASASTPSRAAAAKGRRFGRVRALLSRHERLFLVAASALCTLLLLMAWTASRPPPRELTQKDIDAAVLHTMQEKVMPSPEKRAYRAIQPSVVRVRQLGHVDGRDGDVVRGVGTGVVIVDKGVILTNLHVVAGAEKVQVTFADGTISEAGVVTVQPENDLAVLQAKTIPDDLVAATLRPSRDLAMGDQVIAVGFPFGIGPSVTSGIISGLKREYRSPEGKQALSNLIQFDAAANPGNSGGPLVTMDGEVVGIVTAILNPGDQGVFIGIGFAVPIENAASAAGMSPF